MTDYDSWRHSDTAEHVRIRMGMVAVVGNSIKQMVDGYGSGGWEVNETGGGPNSAVGNDLVAL